MIQKSGVALSIVRDITDQPKRDRCDRVLVEHGQLSFRSFNPNDTYNELVLHLESANELAGEMKSYNCNVYGVRYQRMPEGFEIQRTPPHA